MYWARLFGLNACSENYSIRDMALIKRRTLHFRNYLDSVDYGCNYVVDLVASEVTKPSEGGSSVKCSILRVLFTNWGRNKLMRCFIAQQDHNDRNANERCVPSQNITMVSDGLHNYSTLLNSNDTMWATDDKCQLFIARHISIHEVKCVKYLCTIAKNTCRRCS